MHVCVCEDLVAISNIRYCDLLKEVLVGDISAVLGDTESEKLLVGCGVIHLFSVDAELLSPPILEDLFSMVSLNSNSSHV